MHLAQKFMNVFTLEMESISGRKFLRFHTLKFVVAKIIVYTSKFKNFLVAKLNSRQNLLL